MDLTTCIEFLTIIDCGFKEALPVSFLGRHWLFGNSAYFAFYILAEGMLEQLSDSAAK